MSDFELGQLKQALKASQARGVRHQIVVMALQKLHREYVNTNPDKYAQKVIISSSMEHFPDFMASTPNVLLPTNPCRLDADKYLMEFRVFHDQWLEEDNEFSFLEWLEIKNQQHDNHAD
jgi:hypothetical protein